MKLFFTEKLTQGTEVRLSSEESKHASKVLRYQKGDVLELTDGKGGWAKAEIIGEKPKALTLKVLESQTLAPPSHANLHIGISLTKNIKRFEWFLEKATEVGVGAITPLIFHRTKREHAKPQRNRKILISALKQSLQYHMPRLDEPVELANFMTRDLPKKRFLAQPHSQDAKPLWSIEPGKKKLLLIVGPEGGLTKDEEDRAHDMGFIPFSLGGQRLRTETAGLASCILIRPKIQHYAD